VQRLPAVISSWFMQFWFLYHFRVNFYFLSFNYTVNYNFIVLLTKVFVLVTINENNTTRICGLLLKEPLRLLW